MEPQLAKRLLKSNDFVKFFEWLESKAEIFKDLGFRELDEKKRLVYLGRYEGVIDIINTLNVLSTKKEVDKEEKELYNRNKRGLNHELKNVYDR